MSSRNSFSGSVPIMKLLGFYPTKKLKHLHRVYACVLYVLAMIPTLVFGLLHFVFYESSITNVYNDFVLMAMMFYAVKYAPCLENSEKIHDCIHYFDEKFFGESRPKHRQFIDEWGKICQRNSNVFVGGAVGCGVCWLVGVLSRDKLPLTVWLPFEPIEHSFSYWCIYFLQVLVILYAVLACSVIDPLVGSLACLATGQLQVLKDNLQNLGDYADEEMRSKRVCEKSRIIYGRIAACVRHYQEILSFVKKYEECFSPIAFTELLESVFIIGFCCLQMSVVEKLEDIILWGNCLVVVFLQIFFYCYYGTGLMVENSTLAEAIFVSKWYEFDVESRKMLIILMECSKKPMIAKAGKFIELSLDTLMAIMKRSYSFSAILRNYY